jgi:hypothetical protein
VNTSLKSFLVPVAAAAVLVGTLLGGWLQGRMITRWGADELLVAAGKRLDQPISDQLGNWRLVNETPFSPDVVRMLQCPAHLSRTYMHEQTGDTVSVMVIVGPPGPVAVHTPEVCYGSVDYTLSAERTPAKVVDRQQREHSLWQISLTPRSVAALPHRVLYAWGTGGPWQATDDPRFAHAGEPYLYKIQLEGPPSEPGDEFDPSHDFLTWFLPALQAHLVPTRTTAPAAPAPQP